LPLAKILAEAEFTSAEHNKSGAPTKQGFVGNKTGYLARYAKLVTSASRGAVLE